MIKKLIIGKTGNLYIQLLRYIVAGGIAFAIDVAILWLLTEHLHIYYLVSSTISFIIGLITSYLISILWVFDEKRIKNKTIEIIIFGIIGGVGLILTSFFMWLFTSVLLFYYLYSKIITTVIVFIWNFIAKKKILFTKKMN
ncbi:MAG: polysaccharide synthesis protein GtrA [Bacteroidetes bacterium]|jgi:putative flippase GtrA|nr:polysaccharide synthesis protein GtrA [Bacteroidota bacterium]